MLVPSTWWYGMKLKDEHIMEVMDDTPLSEFLPSKPGLTHVRCVRFSKLKLNNNELLPILESVITQGGTNENLCKLHRDFSVLYISEPNKEEVRVGPADSFVENLTKDAQFHTLSF